MRYHILLVGSLLSYVRASVIPARSAGSVPIYESTDVVTGQVIRLEQVGFTGTTVYGSVNASSYTPRVTYKQATDSAFSDNSAFSDDSIGDVCLTVADCVGSVYESSSAHIAAVAAATTGFCGGVATSLNDFLSNNDYAETHPIIAGQVLAFVVGLGAAVPIYFINARLDIATGTKSDACGETEPKTYAGNAVDAIFQFCLAIKSVEEEKIAKRYLKADVTSGSATSSTGNMGIAQFFISSKKEDFGPTCADFGVTWKRSLGNAVRSLW